MTDCDDRRVSILLVDDEASGLAALDATLSRLGQNLVRAQSGQEALRLVLQHDFAVILLDVVMPGLDGFETAKLIRARERSSRTPIIFLTGLERGELPLLKAYALGAVDYLLKPYEPEILRSKVAVFVDLAQKTAQVRRSADALAEAERSQHEQELLETHRRFEVEQMSLQRDRLRKEMEVSLDQRRWLEAILDAMPTPLALLDPVARQVVFANPAARSIAGGVLLQSGVPPPAFKLTDGGGGPLRTGSMPADRAMDGEALSGVAINFNGPSGEGSVLAHSKSLRGMYGHAETVLLTLLDVSGLKKVEADLQEALRTREEFLAIASHELLTPLTALRLEIANAVRSWSRNNGSGSAQDRVLVNLREMERSIARLMRLSNYLLDVSRIEAGKLLLERSAFDLAELVREVVNRHRHELEAAGCTATIEAEGAVVGRWDKARLDQVLTNLLTNAIKYAPGKPVELEVAANDKGASVVVRDHGEGIPLERRARIFRKFERGSGTNEGQGFGLGLWIVDQIVSRHGGSVEAVSESGAGARFTICLPRDENAPTDRLPRPLRPTLPPIPRNVTEAG